MNRAARAAIALTATAACSLTPALGANELGAGHATGTLTCNTGQSQITLASEHLVYGDTLRTVTATIAGPDDCREPGTAVIGPARITGDGITCGTNPAQPFTGHIVLVTPGTQVTGGLYGTCTIDGTQRQSRFAYNGAVVNGQFVGYLMPTGDMR